MILFVGSCKHKEGHALETGNNRIADGDTVWLHFYLHTQCGERIDESSHTQHGPEDQPPQPLKVIAGRGELVKPWDDALINMRDKEFKTIAFKASDAFGSAGVPDNIKASDTLMLHIFIMQINKQH